MGLSTTLPGMGPGVWRVTFGGTIRDALFIVRILIAGAPGDASGRHAAGRHKSVTVVK